ncbi:Uu.00g131250.m01.CDS01 [Anthostomella pinea]|uniref:glucan 1,3-beta-glucosidase n=1 Tax=Anthostomella pinea TaxID=933095 RepID=A0AAI8YI95_9PEZI|nr:Uu.00g131250.m01.CDS01 [Anthostomella pinea]
MLSKFTTTALIALSGAWVAESRPAESSTTPARNSRRWLPGSDKIRGVNLGSHFIIEKWMAGDEWNTMGCGDTNDEWSCVQALGQDAADIKNLGLNTVRIPVGFWINEDLVNDGEYYPKGGLEYLDYIVGNCTEAGLYVIMDLHGGPGVQTPNQQFTGHSVSTPGFYTADNYERAYKFLEWMTERVHTNSAYYNVGMIEVINEPVQSGSYPSEAADMIANYYPTAWSRIRAREDQLSVTDSNRVHIQMMATAWGSGDPSSSLTDQTFAAYDDHRYLKWDTSVTATQEGYISAACSDNRGGDDIIIGEWSISVADDVQYNAEFDIKDTDANNAWYKDFWAAQAQAFERSGGWIFWSWKCNYEISGFNEWRWCCQSAAAAGIIPQDASSAASISPCS